MSHLKVQPLVSHDGIGCTHIQTTERVIIKNTHLQSSASESSYCLTSNLQNVVVTVTCTSYIMHIACPEQSTPKEVLGEGYISDALLCSLCAQTWACIQCYYFTSTVLECKWLSSSGANLLSLYSIFMIKNPRNLKCLKMKLLI